jgi:hypothetical protein
MSRIIDDLRKATASTIFHEVNKLSLKQLINLIESMKGIDEYTLRKLMINFVLTVFGANDELETKAIQNERSKNERSQNERSQNERSQNEEFVPPVVVMNGNILTKTWAEETEDELKNRIGTVKPNTTHAAPTLIAVNTTSPTSNADIAGHKKNHFTVWNNKPTIQRDQKGAGYVEHVKPHFNGNFVPRNNFNARQNFQRDAQQGFQRVGKNGKSIKHTGGYEHEIENPNIKCVRLSDGRFEIDGKAIFSNSLLKTIGVAEKKGNTGRLGIDNFFKVQEENAFYFGQTKTPAEIIKLLKNPNQMINKFNINGQEFFSLQRLFRIGKPYTDEYGTFVKKSIRYPFMIGIDKAKKTFAIYGIKKSSSDDENQYSDTLLKGSLILTSNPFIIKALSKFSTEIVDAIAKYLNMDENDANRLQSLAYSIAKYGLYASLKYTINTEEQEDYDNVEEQENNSTEEQENIDIVEEQENNATIQEEKKPTLKKQPKENPPAPAKQEAAPAPAKQEAAPAKQEAAVPTVDATA